MEKHAALYGWTLALTNPEVNVFIFCIYISKNNCNISMYSLASKKKK